MKQNYNYYHTDNKVVCLIKWRKDKLKRSGDGHDIIQNSLGI